MFTDTQRLWRVAAQRDLTAVDAEGRSWIQQFRTWQFADAAQRPPADAAHAGVQIVFWPGAVGSRWSGATILLRPVPAGHGRATTRGPRDRPANHRRHDLVQFRRSHRQTDGYPGNVRLLYGTLGTGQAKIIQNGQVIEGTWRKTDRWSRTLFRDRYGREVPLQPGKIWVETVPLHGSVTES